ncbi:regulator RcnB of Ni and Co efflux [Sphingomonas palmae]|uniref:Regulator RcnB of Ni and Co efflux n=1 Tax=Sphingomonas palmae TaxID=1855283 RepID=A0A1H7RPP2_9SPHN|nr:RcnB family protein [Sphingomonas palmae]SEL62173.1 regulator RcnB of Ni and Co efflux [Sphingomonas palmae]
MRRLITTALLAAVALPAMPAVATAQSREELRRDRQDIRREQRDLNRAYRYGDRDDVRDQRGDLREARREYREDLRGRYGNDWRADRDRNWGRGDWSSWRQQNRALYARGNWRAPFGYQSFRPGVRIAPSYFGTRYIINDPWRYHLPPARGYTRWVRHYNDVILVDQRRGVVVDVIRNFYW